MHPTCVDAQIPLFVLNGDSKDFRLNRARIVAATKPATRKERPPVKEAEAR